MSPAPVLRELIPSGGRRIAIPWSFIASIDPKPPGLGHTRAGCEYVDRCVVCEDGFALEDMFAGSICEWCQERGGLTDPISQGGTVEFKPVTFEDLALAKKWQVIGVFADNDMCQQSWP